jgi:uridine phosphorylase
VPKVSVAPILEFDRASEAVIEPNAVLSPADVPAHAVLCFFREIIARVAAELGGHQVGRLRSEMGDHPIFEVDWGGKWLAIVQAGVGAPLAAGWLEELIAIGCRAFVAVGGAGVLVPELVLGHVIVPTAAVRDEGTSYHYLAPAREVYPSDAAVTAILATLERYEVPYITGKTWTTDAWDSRSWAGHASGRELLFRLAADAVLAIPLVGEGDASA